MYSIADGGRFAMLSMPRNVMGSTCCGRELHQEGVSGFGYYWTVVYRRSSG